MPSPLKRHRGKSVYKRKGARGRTMRIRGKTHQIFSQSIDRKRRSRKRKRGFKYKHAGDYGGLRSKSRI